MTVIDMGAETCGSSDLLTVSVQGYARLADRLSIANSGFLDWKKLMPSPCCI